MRPTLIVVLLLLSISLTGQNNNAVDGLVSYLTSQSVYVRFSSTEGISAGDTLFIQKGTGFIPALLVRERSSTSCVCSPIGNLALNVGDRIIGYKSMVKPAISEKADPGSTVAPPIPVPSADTAVLPVVPETGKPGTSITGFASISALMNFSNSPADNLQRFQYTLSIAGKDLFTPGLAFECFTTFYHKPSKWGEVQDNIFSALKIYNFNVSYRFGKSSLLLLGRKINPLLTNLGANDGVQFQMRFGQFTVGLVAGSRPDYRDYSFNFNLLQAGVYGAHEFKGKNGPVQTTLAFVQQNNNGQTDRRFAYLQHTNGLVKNLNFFGTVEFDLYRNTLDTVDSTFHKSNAPRLTNLYLSLRWRIIKQLSMSLSYSARNNVIWYETYKSYLDRLIELETTQGYLFNITARPTSQLSIGATVGYRFQPGDPKDTRNLNAWITYSRIPALGVALTFTTTLLETSYMSGQVYGLAVSRDFFQGKVYGSIAFRYTGYKYTVAESSNVQNVGEINVGWRILRKLSCSLYVEGTFDKQYQYQRIYLQVTQRF